MRKYLIGITALFALVVVTPVHVQAYVYDGNEMMDFCKGSKFGESKANASTLAACIGYLAGSVDGYFTEFGWDKSLGNDPNNRLCAPDGAQIEQLRQVFLYYMTASPQNGPLSHAASLPLNAFHEAWPCKE